MKKSFLAIIPLILLTPLAWASPDEAKEDTVEIEFGESKIIVLVENAEDLKKLEEHDLNKMMQELEETMREQGDGEKIVIEYSDGVDTVIVEEDEFSQLEREFDAEGRHEHEEHDEWDDDDDDWDRDAYWDKKYAGKKKIYLNDRTQYVSSFHFGVNNYFQDGVIPTINDEQYAVRTWGSWYVGIEPSFQTHIAGPLAIDWGGGINWYNLKYADDRTVMSKGPDSIQFNQTSLNAIKSKLTVAYLSAHFVPVLDFGYRMGRRTWDDGRKSVKTVKYKRTKFRIGAGMYASVRLDSYNKLVWRQDGSGKSKSRTKSDFYIDNFRYGVKGLIGIGDVDFFVTYDLNTLYTEGRGPELHPFTVGVSF